jgi:hypothetical protein
MGVRAASLWPNFDFRATKKSKQHPASSRSKSSILPTYLQLDHTSIRTPAITHAIMSARSSLSSIVRAGIPLSRTAAGRAGPSRFISSSTPNPNRPTPAQSLGSIFEETWGPNSSAALGLSKADEKDIKADLRAAGLSPSIADVPKKVDAQGQTQSRTLYRPGYAAETRPPRVDPLLDLFTNLLMKHGRKAEAQKRIGEVLDVM